MFLPVVTILLAFCIAFLITPLVRRWAFKHGVLDRPNWRKVHRRAVPRLGGMAIYISFTAAVLLTQELTTPIIGLLIGGSLITLVGIVDDIRGMPARAKLVGQILAAVAVIPFGLKVGFLTNPFVGGNLIALGLFGIPVTVFWLVSVTNAVNLIDGLDGLAGGTSFIAALTLAAVIWVELLQNGIFPAQQQVIFLALALAAAILGFLRYNFHPARIFLGDSGSMYLGFNLAALAVFGLAKSSTFISVIIPIVILGMPLMDTFFAVLRRYCKQKPIFQPDKEHLHHRLMALGLSHRQAVLCLYAVNVVLGLSAVIMTLLAPNQAMVLLIVVSIIILALANRTGVIGVKPWGTYLARHTRQRSSRL
ncbi:MAG: undecaprenyl/decaprenyl-phosphate alpha-N-acetylglucosaminyl 1-phosphate transferase [Peptococcaceae bacterium]|nr:MAG: undecaprenyl/decaprenyl-phosphate alpha-N-acetylglucosaminyl 1-phosphate transferase [Peptococcaceae bacterium]